MLQKQSSSPHFIILISKNSLIFSEAWDIAEHPPLKPNQTHH